MSRKRGRYWYKSWCELRTVLLLSMGALVLACLFMVFNQQTMRAHASEPLTYAKYLWKANYNSFGRDLFVVITIVLGCGGLRQEKAQGTSGFTLSLPLSRAGIVANRAFIGWLCVAATAFTPAVVLTLASPYVGQSYPAREAVSFGLLWSCAGSLFYSFTFLLAHVLEGEYTAMLVAMPSLMIYGFITSAPVLNRLPLNIFSLLSGEDTPWFNEAQAAITGPLPWMNMVVTLLAAGSLIYAATRSVTDRDF